LKRLVEKNSGITLLPELAIIDLPASKKQMLRYFKSPAPSRQISLVTTNTFSKRKLAAVLAKEVMNNLPRQMSNKKNLVTMPIE